MVNGKLGTLLGCCLIHLAIGSVYAESVLYPAVSEGTGWSNGLLVTGFSLTILALGVGAALYRGFCKGSRMSRLLQYAAVLYVLAEAASWGAVLCDGDLPAGVDPRYAYTAFLLVKGLALGVLYAGAVLTAASLFTERVGLSTGLVVACFGAGSVIAARLYGLLAATGLANVVLFCGAKWSALLVGALLVTVDRTVEEGSHGLGYYLRAKRSDWLLLSATFFFNICTGISLISNLAATTVGLDAGFTFEDAAWLVAAAGVANTLGRLLLPPLGDKVGLPLVLRLVLGVQLVLLVLPPALWYATVLGVVAVYGAVFALVPGVCKRCFEDGDSAYSALLVWWGLAGFAGPTLYSLAGAAGAYVLLAFAFFALLGFTRFQATAKFAR